MCRPGWCYTGDTFWVLLVRFVWMDLRSHRSDDFVGQLVVALLHSWGDGSSKVNTTNAVSDTWRQEVARCERHSEYYRRGWKFSFRGSADCHQPNGRRKADDLGTRSRNFTTHPSKLSAQEGTPAVPHNGLWLSTFLP